MKKIDKPKKKFKKDKELKTCAWCKYYVKGCKAPSIRHSDSLCEHFKWCSTLKSM